MTLLTKTSDQTRQCVCVCMCVCVACGWVPTVMIANHACGCEQLNREKLANFPLSPFVPLRIWSLARRVQADASGISSLLVHTPRLNLDYSIDA